ncbi:MAG: sugar epimerase [bacterium]|nr:sugar epimerase [bacterium]
MLPEEPSIFPGGIAVDDRGSLRFCNDFKFQDVKRFYHVENMSKDTIRAFHGHKLEAKYAYIPKGTAMIGMVKMVDGETLDHDTKRTVIMSSKKPQILYIPPGWANGMRSLEEDTIIMFFSTTTMEEAENDDFRFDWDVLGKDFWSPHNR